MGPTVGPPTVQRAIMNRFHQNRRSNSNIAPKLETNQAQAHPPLNSPQGSRPTPPSHHSSPSSHSPGFGAQGVMTPPGSDAQLQMHRAQGLPAPSQLHQHPQHPQQLMKPHGPRGLTATAGMAPPLAPAPKGPAGSASTTMGGVSEPYYPSYQNHMEQLGKLTRPLMSFLFNRALFVLD
jgi:hypothetical protein